MDRPRTKQVCTIGPASADKIPDLVAAGMDVARVNFSHGTADDHKAYVHAVRAAAHSARRSVAVMVDLPGPKLRLGELDGGQAVLLTGGKFTLRSEVRAAPMPETPAEPNAEPSAEPPAAVDLPTETEATIAAGAEPDATAEPDALAAEPEAAAAEPEAAAAEPEAVAAEPDAAAAEPEAAAASTDATSTDDDTTGHVQAQSVEAGDANGALVRGADLSALVQVGDRVLLADGAAELRVTAIDGSDVATEIVNGGLVRSRCGVNVPSERFGDGGLTDDDRAAVPRALDLRVDLLAQSFVRSAADVVALKALLPADGPRVVAKIETRAALDDFDAICAAADGIMVARGDLGVDIPFEDVPSIQKDLVRRATAAGRFTIVATQMLESMIGAGRPTRAEASDVANAVLDGADAVMLSAETAIGSHPVEALSAMERICRAAEQHDRSPAARAADPATAITLAATAMAASGGVEGIWCFTRTGRTAELLSIHRPPVPVVAFTLSPVVARRLAVRSGVIPLVLPAGAKNSPLIEQMEAAWRAQRSGADYDTVLLLTTSSQPQGINRLEIHRLGGSGRGT